MNWCRVALHVAEADGASLHIGGDDTESLHIGADIYSVETQPYEGEYVVTPSESTQTLPTARKRLEQDVIVEPIPSNYGRISYSGSVITVW